MIQLFQQGTSYNPEYNKKPPRPKASQKELLNAMHRSLYNKYSYAQNYYYTNNLNMILTRQGKPSIIHTYDQEFYETREYLAKYHEKEVKLKLKKLIAFHQNNVNAPRYFLEPISLDLIVDKNFTKKRKLKRQNQLEKQVYSTKFNLTNQFIKKKLLNFEPILKELDDTKPTTMQFVDLIQDYHSHNKMQKSIQFMIEMEKHHKETIHEECAKINQFNQVVNNKNSNISGSTKLSTTRLQSSTRNIQSTTSYQNFLNQRISIHSQQLTNQINIKKQPTQPTQPIQSQFKKAKPAPLKIDAMIDSARQQQILSVRNNQTQKTVEGKPFFSPKGTIKPNINFRKMSSNLIKIR